MPKTGSICLIVSIPACDGRTDKQTDGHNIIHRPSIASRGKIEVSHFQQSQVGLAVRVLLQ